MPKGVTWSLPASAGRTAAADSATTWLLTRAPRRLGVARERLRLIEVRVHQVAVGGRSQGGSSWIVVAAGGRGRAGTRKAGPGGRPAPAARAAAARPRGTQARSWRRI